MKLNKSTNMITLIVAIAAVVTPIIIAVFESQQNQRSDESMQKTIKDSNEEIQKTLNATNEKTTNEINELKKTQLALLERDLENFKPELKYRILSVGSEQYIPNSIWYYITNMGDDHIYVKNKWTFTGDICNKDDQHQIISYEFSNRTSLDLTKEDGEQDVNVKIQDEFFKEIFPDKKSFLLQLELEMNPYTDTLGSFEDKKFPEKTFIQYDFSEEHRSWMPQVNPSGDINCTAEPTIWGTVSLNTSSIHDFAKHKNYKFPEE